ncbi:MAG TPA: hypothetical protein VHT68_11020 [Pseudolabrys sp.]|jgi:hypothetical protein|nr:hypothetical protein [Pseudolabrys sp.]
MPKYIFLIKDGSTEAHVLELQNDSAAVEEGLKTASGMIRDLSLTRIGTQIQILEAGEEDGKEILKVEIRAARIR